MRPSSGRFPPPCIPRSNADRWHCGSFPAGRALRPAHCRPQTHRARAGSRPARCPSDGLRGSGPGDDEFAKEASEFETIADLKADVTKKLEETNIERAEREYEEAVINAVAENAKVEIPAVMVEKEVDKMVQNLEQRLQYQGLTLDQYFQFTGTDEAKMREYMRENAGTKVKVDLVLEAIEKAENIDATEEEIKEKAIEVAKMYSATENDKMVDLLMQSQQAALRADVMRNKTLNLILGK